MSNTIALTGRLVADCRTGNTGGTAVLNFKLANDVGYGERKHTNFIECALWGKRAEGKVAEYLTKGAQVFVTGELTVKDPRESGGKHYNDISINVDKLELVGGKREDSGNERTQSRNDTPDPDLNDDIPF